MSLKPSTPDHQTNLGRQIGRERAQVDILQGIRQDPDRIWRPSLASPEYIAGLIEGYRETIAGNAPRSLED